ncbi:rhomboid family intramembrane serine protease [Egicoccus sp. AB-alg6-2]|uniref:rhomboid family intramembrane serine protease n=1 Tax=Egicoccus sp. AB-alg6-2 TaxID=3242692 RepID=UPI00359E0300
MSDHETSTTVCYRHPDREATLRCSRCDRPICTDDMIEAPVGYQCPECARGGQPVRGLRDLLVRPLVSQTLVGVIAVVYLVSMAAPLTRQFGLVPALAGVEPWRLVTSAFLHVGLIHIGFNALLLWRLGEMLEPVLGHLRFGALYLAGLAGGALGIVGLGWLTAYTPLAEVPLLGWVFATSPVGVTVGASGAVFGLMGAAMAGMRARGVDPWRTDVGSLVLLNLVITFVLPGISVGGHLGGLLGGFLAGKVLFVEASRARAAAVRTIVAAIAVLLVSMLLF